MNRLLHYVLLILILPGCTFTNEPDIGFAGDGTGYPDSGRSMSPPNAQNCEQVDPSCEGAMSARSDAGTNLTDGATDHEATRNDATDASGDAGDGGDLGDGGGDAGDADDGGSDSTLADTGRPEVPECSDLGPLCMDSSL